MHTIYSRKGSKCVIRNYEHFCRKKPVENCMKIEEKSKRRARSQRGLKKVAHTRSVHMANPISDIGYKGPCASMAS